MTKISLKFGNIHFFSSLPSCLAFFSFAFTRKFQHQKRHILKFEGPASPPPLDLPLNYLPTKAIITKQFKTINLNFKAAAYESSFSKRLIFDTLRHQLFSVQLMIAYFLFNLNTSQLFLSRRQRKKNVCGKCCKSR